METDELTDDREETLRLRKSWWDHVFDHDEMRGANVTSLMVEFAPLGSPGVDRYVNPICEGCEQDFVDGDVILAYLQPVGGGADAWYLHHNWECVQQLLNYLESIGIRTPTEWWWVKPVKV